MTIPYKWLAFFTVSIGAFIAPLDVSIVSVSLPNIGRAFGAEPSVVLWVTVVYLLISVSLMLTVGKVGDLLGRKKIYALGFAVFTGGLILSSLSRSIPELILARIVQGTGGAMIVSLSNALVVSAFPVREQGKALGMLGVFISAGLLTGPVMGGFLLDLLDWRAVFYVRIPIGVIGTIMALVLLKEDSKPASEYRFDWPGAVFLFSCLSCLLLFVNLGGRFGYGSPLGLALGGATLLLLVLFILQERKAPEPTVDLNLFKIPVFASGNITLGLMFFAFGHFIFLMPFYLINGLGHSPTKTGLIIAVVSLTTLVIAPLSGWLSDKIGSRLLCTTGMTLMAVALYFISRFGSETGVGEILVKLVIFGVGVGLFQTPNYSAIMGSSPKNRLGTASAMIATIRQVSISVGVAVCGTVFANYQALFADMLGRRALDPLLIDRLSHVGSFQKTLLLAAVSCGVGIVTSVLWYKASRKEQRERGKFT